MNFGPENDRGIFTTWGGITSGEGETISSGCFYSSTISTCLSSILGNTVFYFLGINSFLSCVYTSMSFKCL